MSRKNIFFANLRPRQHREKVRRFVFERDGGRCFWCGTQVVFEWPGRSFKAPPPPNGATLDHIVPKCEGGTHYTNNLVCACWICNCTRGNIPAEEYLMKKHSEIKDAV